jgi:hypothetical protein
MAVKRKDFLPYEEAKKIVHWHGIDSRKTFWDWHDKNKPANIPKYPNRCYKEFEGWTKFTLSTNHFKQPRAPVRPHDEAIAFIHSLGLRSREEWLEFARSDRCPKDIPLMPEIAYKSKGWISWNHWLGNKPRAKIEAQKIAVKARVAFLMTTEENGTFKYGTLPSFSDLVNKLNQTENNIRVLGCWKDHPVGTANTRVIDVINMYGKETWEGSREFRFWNIYEVLEDLNALFEPVRR